MILHDWPDVSCIQILKAIRASAGPSSKLLLVEDLRPYACVDTTAASEIPGGVAPVPPLPLLPNWGHASLFGYLADLEVSTNFPISHLLNAFLANRHPHTDDGTHEWPRAYAISLVYAPLKHWLEN